jgi:hypothetical protein
LNARDRSPRFRRRARYGALRSQHTAAARIKNARAVILARSGLASAVVAGDMTAIPVTMFETNVKDAKCNVSH